MDYWMLGRVELQNCSLFTVYCSLIPDTRCPYRVRLSSSYKKRARDSPLHLGLHEL